LILDAERIAIGGGISSEPILIEYIRKYQRAIYERNEKYGSVPEIRQSVFRNDANLIGALQLLQPPGDIKFEYEAATLQ